MAVEVNSTEVMTSWQLATTVSLYSLSDDDPAAVSPFPLWLRALVIFSCSVFVIASNVVNLLVLKMTEEIPAISRQCLLNLSCADLLLGLVSCAPCVWPAITGSWPYGAVWCQVAGILHGCSMTVSIWTLALISVDRYLAICHPLRYGALMTSSRCRKVLVALWTFAFITFATPLATKSNLIYYQYSPAEVMCGLYWEYPWFCIATAVYIPILAGSTLITTTVFIVRAVFAMKRQEIQLAQSVGHVLTEGQGHSAKTGTKRPSTTNSTRSAVDHGSLVRQGTDTDIPQRAGDSAGTNQRTGNINRKLQTNNVVDSEARFGNGETTFVSGPSDLRSAAPGGSSAPTRVKVTKRDVKTVKVLGITAVTYFTALGPYVTGVVMTSFFPAMYVPASFRFVTLWLANSNSFMNVFIYSAMYSSFRRKTIALFRLLFCGSNRVHPSEGPETEVIVSDQRIDLGRHGQRTDLGRHDQRAGDTDLGRQTALGHGEANPTLPNTATW